MESNSLNQAKEITNKILTLIRETLDSDLAILKVLTELTLYIEKLKLNEMKNALSIVNSVRQSYLKDMFPVWEDIGSNDKLSAYLNIEKRLKNYIAEMEKRIKELEK